MTASCAVVFQLAQIFYQRDTDWFYLRSLRTFSILETCVLSFKMLGQDYNAYVFVIGA
jgi:hypothetical protein